MRNTLHPPSSFKRLDEPDRAREVSDYLNEQTLRERVQDTAGALGALAAVADLVGGELHDEAVGVAATQIAHSLGRTPEAILWYEGQTNPASWLRRSVGGPEVAWDHEYIWLTGQNAENYKFVLV